MESRWCGGDSVKVKMIPIDGMMVRALVVDEDDEYQNCENCASRCYSHPDLAKTDKDWCLDCNDTELQTKMSDEEMALWTIEQMDAGKIVIVVREA
tara:strand:- start:153 stop:440 length:288 start_codon:yes stop_codon:yes gene_type:complete